MALPVFTGSVEPVSSFYRAEDTTGTTPPSNPAPPYN
jgi:hypothetical protein